MGLLAGERGWNEARWLTDGLQIPLYLYLFKKDKMQLEVIEHAIIPALGRLKQDPRLEINLEDT
jgi:hypothetical protein